MKPRILVVAGPTASGKSVAALHAALALGAEIVSADARQVYRMLDIGTAKPSRDDLAAVPHHFIDHVDITTRYTAGDFYREATVRIAEILARGKRVIVCGGSGLYVKVLVDGIFDGPPIDEGLRMELQDDLSRLGPEVLFAELCHLDPEAAAWVPRNNIPRLLRALEVCRATGMPFSRLRRERMPDIPYETVIAGLRWDRGALYNRIDGRVDEMLEKGFLDEVRALLDAGADPACPALNSVGYKEAIAHLSGVIDARRMAELMKQHTRNFAKRQMTWFRKESRLEWMDVRSDDDVIEAGRGMAGRFFALADEIRKPYI